MNRVARRGLLTLPPILERSGRPHAGAPSLGQGAQRARVGPELGHRVTVAGDREGFPCGGTGRHGDERKPKSNLCRLSQIGTLVVFTMSSQVEVLHLGHGFSVHMWISRGEHTPETGRSCIRNAALTCDDANALGAAG